MPDLADLMEIEVRGAYGRSYNELHEARTAWEEGKDFQIVSTYPPVRTGRYINKGDLEQYAPNAAVRYFIGNCGMVLNR